MNWIPRSDVSAFAGMTGKGRRLPPVLDLSVSVIEIPGAQAR